MSGGGNCSLLDSWKLLTLQELQAGDLPRLPDGERSSLTKLVRRQTEVEKELSEGLVVEEPDMEICDPCICYTKCWLDTVASLFCVSLL